jgi:ketosteroid isomerase-like protein
MAVLRLSRLGWATLVACCVAGCQPKTASVETPIDVEREADAIRSAEADRGIAMKDHDLDQAADHFAPAAMVAWPGADPIRGAPQIRTALAETFKDPNFAVAWRMGPVTVSKDGDLAWAAGTYTLTRTDPATHKAVTDTGPFVETFTKAPDGRWLITTGVSSATTPPPVD